MPTRYPQYLPSYNVAREIVRKLGTRFRLKLMPKGYVIQVESKRSPTGWRTLSRAELLRELDKSDRLNITAWAMVLAVALVLFWWALETGVI